MRREQLGDKTSLIKGGVVKGKLFSFRRVSTVQLIFFRCQASHCCQC